MTSTAATADQRTSSRPSGINPAHKMSSSRARHSVQQKPHVAKTTLSLNTHSVEAYRYRLLRWRAVFKQIERISATRDMPRQAPSTKPSLSVQLFQMRDRFLRHLPVPPYRANHPPVRVRLAVLSNRRVP